MKRTRKMLAFLMAALLALPLLCTTAFAEEGTAGYTFVVDNEVEGYAYSLYQMFTGDIAENTNTTGEDDKYILSNVQWGASVPQSTQTEMYTMFDLKGADRTAAKVAEAITTTAAKSSSIFHDMMMHMAKAQVANGESVEEYRSLEYGDYTVNGQVVTGYGATGIPAGYYLVRNTAVPADNNATYSDYIIKVVGEDIKASTKAAAVQLKKNVQDINDSTEVKIGTLQDSADFDIGDEISYTLTATLPDNYDMFEKYHLIFEDDMSAGLTWVGDGAATIAFGTGEGSPITFERVDDGTEVTFVGGTEKLKSAYSGGQIWKYEIEDLKAYAQDQGIKLAAGDIITITYKAQLNASAVTTSTGNPNRYRIIYSNNPTYPDQLSNSTYDKNVVFTYKAIFNKVDNAGNALDGADFTLEKFVLGKGTEKVSIDGTEYTGGWVDVTELHEGDVQPIKAQDESVFTFKGLDDGHYRLTETATPDGYNTIEPQEFDIKAEHDATSDDPALMSLTGTGENEFEMTPELSTASLTADIVNQPGVVLPSSGGMGTTLLYAVGGILVVGSAVALVVKRRARAE